MTLSVALTLTQSEISWELSGMLTLRRDTRSKRNREKGGGGRVARPDRGLDFFLSLRAGVRARGNHAGCSSTCIGRTLTVGAREVGVCEVSVVHVGSVQVCS